MRLGASNGDSEMTERAEDRVPSVVPWIGLVVTVLAIFVFFASAPTSHTRQALCMAFASIYVDNCRGSPQPSQQVVSGRPPRE
jgi:hypothetical protein